jgi:hypothetical protein
MAFALDFDAACMTIGLDAEAEAMEELRQSRG